MRQPPPKLGLSHPLVDLGEIFTKEQLLNAKQICSEGTTGAVNRLEEEIVKPNMEHINTVTKQRNDPRYFAYLLQYLSG